MRIILFCHPDFLNSQSMQRFATMLEHGYAARGHQVVRWTPEAKLFNLFRETRFSKWAGYVDQYILFPRKIKKDILKSSRNTLYVFCDQALGPWIPLVKKLPHIIHAHDLLALRSALGEFPENPTRLTGKIYQKYIRNGFSQGRNFISISEKTKKDLHYYGGIKPYISEVVYNGLNYPYSRLSENEAKSILIKADLPITNQGMLLHVGENSWYKNKLGILAIYKEYVARNPNPLPLWMIGKPFSAEIQNYINSLPSGARVHRFENLENITLQATYSLAKVFLFPSLAEGFGWPIIESMACGCPVITTNLPPMNEVGGKLAIYLPPLEAPNAIKEWSIKGAATLQNLVDLEPEARLRLQTECILWAENFQANNVLDKYLAIYEQVLGSFSKSILQ